MRFRTRSRDEVDTAAFTPLLEESQDLHADSMVATTASLDEMVELGHERRATDGFDPDETAPSPSARHQLLPVSFGGKMLAAAGAGAALAAVLAGRAFASSPSDIQILQTAASIETLAVATYTTALTLPFIGGAEANGGGEGLRPDDDVAAHAAPAGLQRGHHPAGGQDPDESRPRPAPGGEQGQAGPDRTRPGGGPGPRARSRARPRPTWPTWPPCPTPTPRRSRPASWASKPSTRPSSWPCRRCSTATPRSCIALPPNPLSSLPAAAGSVGFPDAFFPTNEARPAAEGACHEPPPRHTRCHRDLRRRTDPPQR